MSHRPCRPDRDGECGYGQAKKDGVCGPTFRGLRSHFSGFAVPLSTVSPCGTTLGPSLYPYPYP